MKFLCDNCKAKYQIADDKVAGKTVRMKCRKCGHQIEVRAAVTETSVSTAPPRSPSEPPRAGLATSLSSTKPRSPASFTSTPPTGALAGAFQRTVQTPSGAPFGGTSIDNDEEWYVAINGVPVGPIRTSELRRKAASGAVTEDSLCWQEGLEEWRPVRAIPDLARIVREAAQGGRISLAPPPEPRAPSPPRPPQRPLTAKAPEPPRAPAPSGASRSNVVPLHARMPERIEDGPLNVTAPLAPPLGVGAAAVAAAPAPLPTAPATAPLLTPAPPAPIQPPPPAAVSVAADPFAVPARPTSPSFPPTGSAPPPALDPHAAAAFGSTTPSVVPAPAPSKRGTPLWFYPVMVVAGAFGVTAAYFTFVKPPAPSPGPVATATPSAPPPTTASTTLPPAASDSANEEVPPPEVVPSVTVAHGSPTNGKAPPKTNPAPVAASSSGKTVDLKSLLGGPGSGPTSGPSPTNGGAGGTLDSASVQRVVADHRLAVRRACWERSDKGSVNVLVTATVAADGHVSAASSSGDDPAIGKCIEARVRSWRFPAPGSPTEVKIPFKFVRQ